MFFEETVSVRLRSKDLARIQKIVSNDPEERYKDVSHFIRCSIERLLRTDERKKR